MKTRTRQIFSVMLSLFMALMCMTTASVYADYQVIPEQSHQSMNKMTFFMDNLQVSAGNDLQLDIKAINPVAIKSLEHIILTVPNGFEVMGMSDSSSMFGGSSITYEVSGNSLNFSITSDGSLNENGIVATINLHVSEIVNPNTYDFKWITTAMSCKMSTGNSYAPTFLMGRITVNDSSSTQQTTATSSSTTTSTTITTTTTTSTTTASAYINVTIDSLPTKTAYTVGEELDLSGGKWHSDGIKTDGTPFNSVPYDMTNNSRVDTSAFDNSKAGTYRIYLRENVNGLYGENFFDITVSEPAFTLGDINGDGFIDSVDATAVLIEYARLSASDIGTFNENQKKSADLNKDGFTDSVDATLIMMYYAYVSAGKNDTLENWLFTNNI